MQLRLVYKTGFLSNVLKHLIKYLITDSLIFKVRLPLLVSFHTPAKHLITQKRQNKVCSINNPLFFQRSFYCVSFQDIVT